MVLERNAYAKVNLHLSVQEKREDGFHELISLFQLISLSDRIQLTVKEHRDFQCMIEGTPFVETERNTMYAAAVKFCRVLKRNLSISIRIDKRIPSEAGLGGGSSDAACVLHLLNDALDHPVDGASLQIMAAEIGSDVPFFLSKTSAAIVRGRGEVIFPIASRPDLEGLVVLPHLYRVSTRDAFSRLDEKRKNAIPRPLTRAEIEHIYRLPCSQWTFSNDFLPIIDDPKGMYPVLHRYCRNLDSCFGTLSGTGSAFCCISSETASIDALERLIVRDDNNHTLFRIKCLHT